MVDVEEMEISPILAPFLILTHHCNIENPINSFFSVLMENTLNSRPVSQNTADLHAKKCPLIAY
jgi:hypothetical protein